MSYYINDGRAVASYGNFGDDDGDMDKLVGMLKNNTYATLDFLRCSFGNEATQRRVCEAVLESYVEAIQLIDCKERGKDGSMGVPPGISQLITSPSSRLNALYILDCVLTVDLVKAIFEATCNPNSKLERLAFEQLHFGVGVEFMETALTNHACTLKKLTLDCEIFYGSNEGERNLASVCRTIADPRCKIEECYIHDADSLSLIHNRKMESLLEQFDASCNASGAPMPLDVLRLIGTYLSMPFDTYLGSSATKTPLVSIYGK